MSPDDFHLNELLALGRKIVSNYGDEKLLVRYPCFHADVDFFLNSLDSTDYRKLPQGLKKIENVIRNEISPHCRDF